MSPAFIALVAGFLVAIATAFGGFTIGRGYERQEASAAQVKALDKIIVQTKTLTVMQDRIVERWHTKTNTIVVNAEDEKHEITTLVAADCVLPGDFIVQLHAISRNTTAQALGLAANSSTGADCRATLEALRQSYANHYLDANQLNSILEFEAGVDATLKGATP